MVRNVVGRQVAERTSASTAAKPLTKAHRRSIVSLQNEVRNAINVSSGREPKLGVQPSELKDAMQRRGVDVAGITVRNQRLPAASDLIADYRLYRGDELLFRLKLVPWERPNVWGR